MSVSFYGPTRNPHLGIQFNYPKEILYLETKKVISTKDLSTYKLYNDLIKNIKKRSSKAKALKDDKLYRPNFWVSKKACSEINNNVNLKKEGITLL